MHHPCGLPYFRTPCPISYPAPGEPKAARSPCAYVHCSDCIGRNLLAFSMTCKIFFSQIKILSLVFPPRRATHLSVLSATKVSIPKRILHFFCVRQSYQISSRRPLKHPVFDSMLHCRGGREKRRELTEHHVHCSGEYLAKRILP